MKARKKGRQRKRKARAKLRYLRSADKAFAISVMEKKRLKMQEEKQRYPHMEWDGKDFVPRTPSPSPYVTMDATVMEAAHKKLGVDWKGCRKGVFGPRQIKGLADSGCQTCTAGVDFLKQIGCPISYLVPTSHRINGITAAKLGIIGSVMLRFQIGNQVSRQMVHISENIRGLYLSETALLQLGVIHRDFPQQIIDNCASVAYVGTPTISPCCIDEGADKCMGRTKTPTRPDSIPFEPIPENRDSLEKWFLDSFASSAFNTCTHSTLQSMTGVPMKAVRKKDNSHYKKWYTPISVAFH